MPSKTSSKPPARPSASADFDDYLLEGDLSDNPFRSPSPGAAATSTNKRKEPASGLGIEEEVEVKKRATVPRVKLDEARFVFPFPHHVELVFPKLQTNRTTNDERLLSEAGIPKLRRRAAALRLKGKGHEWSDAARLLSLYQIWLDDLFPKAKFLDALAMVEKAGHKGTMHKARLGWIEEGKPKSRTAFGDGEGEDDDEHGTRLPETGRGQTLPSRIAPVFEMAKTGRSGSGGRQATPDREDLFGEDGEDIYGATPRRGKGTLPAAGGGGGEPDEDDLDALMAEAEAQSAPARSLFDGGKPASSLFGGGKPASSLFGGPVATTARANEPEEEDDLDALMAEAEGQGSLPKQPVSSTFGGPEPKPPPAAVVAGDEDDLEALMAEAEADGASSMPIPANVDAAKKLGENGGLKDSFADEEEAMAEMEGLW
jgi:replication fork protection complex subunit Csm3/Swi3